MKKRSFYSEKILLPKAVGHQLMVMKSKKLSFPDCLKEAVESRTIRIPWVSQNELFNYLVEAWINDFAIFEDNPIYFLEQQRYGYGLSINDLIEQFTSEGEEVGVLFSKVNSTFDNFRFLSFKKNGMYIESGCNQIRHLPSMALLVVKRKDYILEKNFEEFEWINYKQIQMLESEHKNNSFFTLSY